MMLSSCLESPRGSNEIGRNVRNNLYYKEIKTDWRRRRRRRRRNGSACASSWLQKRSVSHPACRRNRSPRRRPYDAFDPCDDRIVYSLCTCDGRVECVHVRRTINSPISPSQCLILARPIGVDYTYGTAYQRVRAVRTGMSSFFFIAS